MVEARTFREVIGARAREQRQSQGLTQDGVAGRCRLLGFSATRSVIDSIERGIRHLELPELLVLLAVLELDLRTLLEQAGLIALEDGRSIDGGALAGQLNEPINSVEVRRGDVTFVVSPARVSAGGFSSVGGLRSFVGGFSDAEMKAARKLSVDPETVADVSERLWGHSLTFERDKRVFEQQPVGATPRTVQAIRGHVTRALLAELTDALSDGGKS